MNKTQTTLNYTVRKSARISKKLESSKTAVKRRHEDTDLHENNDSSVSRKCVPPINKLEKISNNANQTKQLLSSSFVSTIVGRVAECQQITDLVSNHLNGKQSLTLYISGAAGTGKTLTVNHVISSLRKKYCFKLIDINCMSVRNSSAIYGKIAQQLDVKLSKSKQNLNAIKEIITGKTDEMIVLILDEMDQLEAKNDRILENMLLWSTLDKSRIILIGIANDLDLTNRLLSPLKHLGLLSVKEIQFTPYSKDQIIDIIEDRIERSTSDRLIKIKREAIQLCARKIGSCSGDIRKALDICRRAVDTVESKLNDNQQTLSPLKLKNDDGFNKTVLRCSDSQTNFVDVPDIMAILNQVYGTKSDQTIGNSKQCVPFHQQIVLCALLLFAKHKRIREVKLSDCFQVFVNISVKRGISYDAKNESEFINMCHLLQDNGFIAIKSTNQNVRNAKLSLIVDENEIEYTLSDKMLLKSILQQPNCYFK